MLFASAPNGPVVGTGVPTTVVLEAGSAADLQRIVNETLADLAATVGAQYLLSVEVAAAGNGNQWACALSYSVGYTTLALVGTLPPLLSSFAAAAASRSQVLFGQGGAAAEAAAALTAAVLALKTAVPPVSVNAEQFGVQLTGSSNGGQWLASTVLFVPVAAP